MSEETSEIPLSLGDLATLWVSVACFVVVLYDWALVFDREVAYIWRRGWSSASLIYLTLRYVTVGSFILTMLDIFPYPGKSSAVSTSFDRCNVIARLDPALGTVILTSSAVFSSLRSYALCKNRAVSMVVGCLGTANAVPSLISAVQMGSIYHPRAFHTVCDFAVGNISMTRTGLQYVFLLLLLRIKVLMDPCVVLIVARSCAVTADFIVLILTWRRSWPLNVVTDFNNAFTNVIFHDGVSYFATLCATNLVSLALVKHFQLVFVLSGIINMATVVLTCRFILDLHDASNGVGRSHSSATSGYGVSSIGHPRGAAYLSTVQLDFNSVVASEVYEAVIGWDRVAWSDGEDHSDELYEL